MRYQPRETQRACRHPAILLFSFIPTATRLDYATNKLTFELQRLRQQTEDAKTNPPCLPTHFRAEQFTVRKDIAGFLRRLDEHQRKTAKLDIGRYS